MPYFWKNATADTRQLMIGNPEDAIYTDWTVTVDIETLDQTGYHCWIVIDPSTSTVGPLFRQLNHAKTFAEWAAAGDILYGSDLLNASKILPEEHDAGPE